MDVTHISVPSQAVTLVGFELPVAPRLAGLGRKFLVVVGLESALLLTSLAAALFSAKRGNLLFRHFAVLPAAVHVMLQPNAVRVWLQSDILWINVANAVLLGSRDN
jgi:hypothetical protein